MPGRPQMPSKTIKNHQTIIDAMPWVAETRQIGAIYYIGTEKWLTPAALRPCASPPLVQCLRWCRLALPSTTPPFSPLFAFKMRAVRPAKNFQKSRHTQQSSGGHRNGIADGPSLVRGWCTLHHRHRPYRSGRTSFLGAGFGAGFGDGSAGSSGTCAV
jgi:hypothetical protein